jgi:hypothetical protein
MSPSRTRSAIAALVMLMVGSVEPARCAPTDDPSPPAEPVRLVFVHHSTGQNWLADGYGNLGRTLGENNYYVSDTNYGWGPGSIGDRTDIPDWLEWFAGADTPTVMAALYAEGEQRSDYSRTLDDPGGENRVILFKSCFPNSDLSGGPDDPPTALAGYTVGHAKYVYNTILDYFAQHTDKLFLVVAAPPLSDGTHAANARAFNNWLVYQWLWENDYSHGNVAVLDFYTILTHSSYHHRFLNGDVRHSFGPHNTNFYPSSPGDDHPSAQGSRKATAELVPLINVFYRRWQAGARNLAIPADGAWDGWVRESSESSGQGGLVDSAGVGVRVGDDAADRQYRSVLSFDTARLPDGAVIYGAMLKLKHRALAGTDPFATHGALLVDVRRGRFGGAGALEPEDFEAPASRAAIASLGATGIHGWHSAAVRNLDFPRIDPQRSTQLRLRFAQDDNDDRSADYRVFHSADTAAPPSLWITYRP